MKENGYQDSNIRGDTRKSEQSITHLSNVTGSPESVVESVKRSLCFTQERASRVAAAALRAVVQRNAAAEVKVVKGHAAFGRRLDSTVAEHDYGDTTTTPMLCGD